MRVASACTFVLILVSVIACGVEPEANSGGDEKRAAAKEIPLAEPVHDRVAPSEGDTTDWKKFAVPRLPVGDQGAPVTNAYLNAWWDNPDAMVKIKLHDQFGGEILTLEHLLGERKESWRVPVYAALNYYLQVVGNTGKTVYTLELVLEEGGPDRAPLAVPPPE